MEAYKLKTRDDLSASSEERVELIDGEIVRRPMARSEHGLIHKVGRALSLVPAVASPVPAAGGLSPRSASAMNCTSVPATTLPAGAKNGYRNASAVLWRRHRIGSARSSLPATSARIPCSCSYCCSATGSLFLLLQRHRVPFYWLIWPEDRVLIAYRIEGSNYRVAATVSGQGRARIPPFDGVELDLSYILSA